MKYTDPRFYFPDVFLTEEDRMIQNMVRDFVNKEIMPVRQLLDDDKEGELVRKIRQSIADIGLQALPFPKEYGGGGNRSQVTSCIIGEELARGDVGIAVANGCTGWAWNPAIRANNKAILDRFMPDFCGKELRIACYQMTEPGGPHGGGGVDIENPYLEGRKIRTIAKLEDDEWVINGTKLWASNSGVADLNCVTCTTDPDLGREGMVLIYVPEPWEGVSHSPFENKAGVSSDNNCATYFDDVRVPREWGIGPGEEAARLFYANLLGPRNCAFAVGTMQGAFETVLEYTGDRIVGDKPIRQHSLAAEVLGEMAIAIDTARIYYLAAAYMFDHPEIYGPSDQGFMAARMNIAKAYGSKAVVEVINKAMNLMGSYGYVRENHMEKYWRDSKMFSLWVGGVNLNTMNVCRGYYDLYL